MFFYYIYWFIKKITNKNNISWDTLYYTLAQLYYAFFACEFSILEKVSFDGYWIKQKVTTSTLALFVIKKKKKFF